MGNLFGRDGLGKWIAFDDPKIDDYIDNILNEIVSKTVNKFYPETIILDGSFAQGEGTVIKKNENLRMVMVFPSIVKLLSSGQIRLLCQKMDHLFVGSGYVVGQPVLKKRQ